MFQLLEGRREDDKREEDRVRPQGPETSLLKEPHMRTRQEEHTS